MPDPQPPGQPYRFGPIALLARFQRWHATAPLWQILLLTIVLIVLIVLVWCGSVPGIVRR